MDNKDKWIEDAFDKAKSEAAGFPENEDLAREAIAAFKESIPGILLALGSTFGKDHATLFTAAMLNKSMAQVITSVFIAGYQFASKR